MKKLLLLLLCLSFVINFKGCKKGLYLIDGKCQKKQCKGGTIAFGHKCICPPGQKLFIHSCDTPKECPSGYTRTLYNTCVESCPSGSVRLDNNTCQECPEGTKSLANECISTLVKKQKTEKN